MARSTTSDFCVISEGAGTIVLHGTCFKSSSCLLQCFFECFLLRRVARGRSLCRASCDCNMNLLQHPDFSDPHRACWCDGCGLRASCTCASPEYFLLPVSSKSDLAGSVLCFCVMFPAVLPCQVRTAVVFLKQFQFIQDGSNVESIYSKGASRNPQIFADGFQQEVSVHVPQGLQRFPNCFDFRMPQKCGSAS